MSEKRARTLPCPFAHCRNANTLPVEIEMEDLFAPGKILRSWRVSCPKCGAQGPWGGPGEHGKAMAIVYWNDRVTD